MKRSMVFEGVAVTLLLLLAFLLLAAVVNGGPESNAPGMSDLSYTYVGSDNILYAFAPDHIQAIDAGGRQVWNFSVPSGWEVGDNCMPVSISSDGTFSFSPVRPSAASDNGTLYVFLKPAHAAILSNAMEGRLMAVSRDGRALWTLPLASYAIRPSHPPSDNSSDWVNGDVTIKASGGRAYVFHDFNETVIDSNGTALWNAANVSDPAAVDPAGFVYCVEDRAAPGDDITVYDPVVQGLPLPSATIDAYYPNGTLYWENDTGSPMQRQGMNGYYYGQPLEAYSLPMYHDGLLYAPTANGIGAFYRDGTAKWVKAFGKDELKLDFPAGLYQKPGWFVEQETAADLSLYAPMPFDAKGNVYLIYRNDGIVPGYRRMLLVTLDPDGNVVSEQHMDLYQVAYQYVKDGIGYSYDHQAPGPGDISDVRDLGGFTLHAYDIKSGKELWSYQFTARDPTMAVIDGANVRRILGGYPAQEAIDDAGDSRAGVQPTINSGDSLDIQASNDTVYANFQSYNYEYPVVLGKSKLAYAGGIYALDRNGSLLWYKPVRAQDYFMQVTPNGTVFYRTPDGRIGATNSGIAAGFTVTALLYIFVRFLCVGAVARAKARLGKNENRNRALEFIAKSPGSTLVEISDGTGMNMGTARYHLFVLGMNHKIVSCADGKFIRYFTNSNTYSREQRLVISLARREAVGKILGILARKPGMSNVEIAGEAGLPESITSRYLKELSEKGVVAREPDGVRGAYSIHTAYSGHVADAIRRFRGE